MSLAGAEAYGARHQGMSLVSVGCFEWYPPPPSRPLSLSLKVSPPVVRAVWPAGDATQGVNPNTGGWVTKYLVLNCSNSDNY